MVGGNENMSKENTAVTKKKMKRCKEDVVFDAACFIILTLVLFVVAYPLYWVIISSISAPSAVSSGKVLLHPIGFTLKGYAEVFKNDQVMRGFLNSLIITFCGVMVNLIVTLPTSYALSRSNFSGKKPITIFYLITMFFGGGLIPTYLVIQRLQMLNTIWALILPGCLSVYNMIVARTFFKSNISEELYEDGLETYLERVSLDMTNFTSKEAEEKKEKTAGSDTKKVVVVDEKALARMYQYIQRNYGKTWLSESEEKSRNYQLCRGIHSDCSLYYTEGVLKNPVGKYYQLSYAQKQKDKNLHAYYDQHRAVRQNISLLYQELKKAMLLQEDQSFADADHGILQPARMWKVGRSQNADLFRLEQRRNSLDFVVDILVDASGSQRPQENVTLQTYILAETLSRLHIPFRVMSFCTFWDYTILHRMRDYDDPREKNSNIFEYITSSNNRDGLAVKAAGIDLLKRQEDRKLLILLSDGKPYDVLVNRPNARNPKPYRDDYALHDTATEVRRLRQQGVSVLGVFVGEETELMAEQKIFGKDFAYARDIRNFSHMVGSYLRRKIEE